MSLVELHKPFVKERHSSSLVELHKPFAKERHSSSLVKHIKLVAKDIKEHIELVEHIKEQHTYLNILLDDFLGKNPF